MHCLRNKVDRSVAWVADARAVDSNVALSTNGRLECWTLGQAGGRMSAQEVDQGRSGLLWDDHRRANEFFGRHHRLVDNQPVIRLLAPDSRCFLDRRRMAASRRTMFDRSKERRAGNR